MKIQARNRRKKLIIVLAKVTASNLNIRKWVDLLSGLLDAEGRYTDVRPAICDKDGSMEVKWIIAFSFI